MRANTKRQQRGFTFLEMLMAIAIFAFLAIAAYQLLAGVQQSDELSERHGARLRQVQRAMTVMQRDFSQMAARPFRDESQEQRPLFKMEKFLHGSDAGAVEMVSLGWRNPQAMLPRSELQRSSYLLRDQQLIKAFYNYPDAVVGQEPREQVLLDQVEDLNFRVYQNGSWRENFGETDALPEGVEVTILTADYGELRRVFLVPQGERGVVLQQAQDQPTNSNQGNNNQGGNSQGGNNQGGNNQGGGQQ
ncbi:type II secretion system minor pseudopilin GspJ [Aliagarivorans marinus]|uniref:type II secretion system minor pseudopilin GspJ n=1 Tax=Aliagarivorans marinus TaxID=561965 RepID=UPI0003FDE887|nr:type II secretion system minor pseudopilin GspJ [Aliagarivorans marinus]